METLSKTKLGQYARLKLKKNRDEKGLFIAEGAKCVSDLLGHFECVAVIATTQWAEAHRSTPLLMTASREALKRLSSMSTPAEVVAIFRKPTIELDDSVLPKKLYLMVEEIQDPGNLGTIVRIADWFGIDTVFASRNCADIFGSKAVQATMGALARVRVVYSDLEDLIRSNPDMPVYGTLLSGRNIYEAKLTDYGFILMGNEGKGVSATLQALITSPLLIPSYPADAEHTDSLNVAMATAITVAEFRRRQTLQTH